MASRAQELVGLKAFSRDGDRIGKVKGVLCDPESDSECLVIKRSLTRDLVVPADVVEASDGSVTIPFTRSFLNVAPRIASEGPLSAEERGRLQRFYHPSAG
jgi:ribosomal 30S subunit maturation factor RimM